MNRSQSTWDMSASQDTRDRGSDERMAQLADFTALIGHELATPLSVVTMAASAARTLATEVGHREVVELLEIIDRNARLAGLLLGRLELARDIEQDVVNLRVERVDVSNLVLESVNDLREVVLRGRPLVVSAPGAVEITADPTALREIVFNLLTNASKYSEPSTLIEVSVTEQDDGFVAITVKDQGKGIPPETRDMIFERYVQIDERGPGVGLGLFISRGIARAHGGDIRVRPSLEKGSEFVVLLPTS